MLGLAGLGAIIVIALLVIGVNATIKYFAKQEAKSNKNGETHGE